MANDGSHVARCPPFRVDCWISQCLPDLRRRMVDEVRNSNHAWLNHCYSASKGFIKGFHPFTPVMLEWLEPLVHFNQSRGSM